MKIRVLIPTIISLILFYGFSKNDANEIKVISNGDILYSSNEIIVKFRAETIKNRDVSLLPVMMKILSIVPVESIDQIYPTTENYSIKHQHGIDRIYSIKYSGNSDPLILSKKISSLEGIEYAEPRYIYKVDFTPNDPNIGSQYYLSKINVYNAWDISKGDSSVVIGIVDTGVYWYHPDLTANIWINLDEIPGNGMDDDGNGFIDDIRGWDFGGLNGTPDNNPSEDAPYHGTHVGGIASASTNNAIGVAGIGFKCKIMAIKTARDDKKDPSSGSPYIWYGYEGIIYAADNGAQIINCSWGGPGFSQLGQDVINYANAKGSLVVAAAGNSNSSSEHFPSGYNYVVSVAATNSDDSKASYSNYGFTIDVSAPGTSLLNTWSDYTYISLSGTSMASPVVAGVAGLVKAKYTSFNPEQVAEKIRVTADDIYNINQSYRYQLGKGRINAYRALQDSLSTAVRFLSFELDDNAPLGNGNQTLEPNEMADVKLVFKNYLNPTSNLSITITSLTTGINIINGSFNAGVKSTGEVFNNFTSPFRIQASSSLSYDLTVKILVNFSDGSYSDWQVLNFVANPSYVVSNNNNILITIGSKGNLAFNDYPNNTQGRGFRYKNSSNLLFEGALIAGTSSSKVVDVARNQSGNAQSQDFRIVNPVKIFQPGSVADMQALSIFNDDGATTNKLGIKVILNTYSFADLQNSDYVILHYRFINTTSTTISNFYAGLFFDWDLIENSGADDIALWDSQTKMGYVYNQPGTTPYYVGAALISHTNYHFRAINNAGDNSWGIYDGFTKSEKWEAISSGISKTQAGAGDVSFVVAGGPYTINAGDTLSLAFTILAGNNLSALRTTLTTSKQKWNNIITSVNDKDFSNPITFSLAQNYPNPFNSRTIIKFSIPAEEFTTLKIYDIIGKEITTIINQVLKPGLYDIAFDAGQFHLTSGIYLYELKSGKHRSIRKFIYMK